MSSKHVESSILAKAGSKRKRRSEHPIQRDKTSAAPKDGNPSEGSRKKKQKNDKRPLKRGKEKGEPQDSGKPERKYAVDESIAMMDGRLLADHFAQKARRLDKEMTTMELNDLSVPDFVFSDTTSFKTSRSLDQLPAFLKEFTPGGESKLSKSPENNGMPHTLVISSAALRAVDAVRALRAFQNKDSIIGKLFAKHIKLEDAKLFLERARMGVGVGTPARLADLIESGTLKLDELERVVIDGSYIDQKQRGIFDMKETHIPLLQLLTRPELRRCYERKEKPTRILVF